MKFNLSRFKKISSDKHSTTLEHPEGHRITIAHGSLSPKMRGQLAELPMAEGGEVGPTGFPKIEVKKGQFDQDAKRLAGDKPKLQGYKDGGPIVGDKESQKRAQELAAERMKSIQVSEPKQANRAPASESSEEAVDPVKTAQANARSDSEARDAKEWEAYAKRQKFADGGEAQKPEQPQGPVVINIGGQGQMPQQMPSPQQFAASASQIQQAEADKARQEADAAPYGTGETIMGSGERVPLPPPQTNIVTQKPVMGRAPAAMSAENPQLNAPSQAPRAPQSGLSLQQPSQLAPQQPQDGLAAGQQQAQPEEAQPGSEAPDPYGTRVSSERFQQGVTAQTLGMKDQATEAGKLGQEEARIHARAAAANQKALSDYQAIYKDTADKISGAIEALKEGKINPEHYMQSMSTAGKIGTLIGLVGAGFGGRESARQAMAHLDRQIELDVQAQRDAKKSVFSGYLQQLGNAKDAAEMARIFNTSVYAQQLEGAASKAKDPMAQARFLELAGQLNQQVADRMGQYSMRKTLESGVANGIIPPEHLIRAVVPDKEKDEARKELAEAQKLYKQRDNALDVFDKVDKLQTLAERAGAPLQSPSQLDAQMGPVLSEFSREFAGKFSEFEMKTLRGMFPLATDDAKTRAVKRANLVHLLDLKLNFPLLKGYNIDPSASSRYNNRGESKLKLAPPVRR